MNTSNKDTILNTNRIYPAGIDSVFVERMNTKQNIFNAFYKTIYQEFNKYNAFKKDKDGEKSPKTIQYIESNDKTSNADLERNPLEIYVNNKFVGNITSLEQLRNPTNNIKNSELQKAVQLLNPAQINYIAIQNQGKIAAATTYLNDTTNISNLILLNSIPGSASLYRLNVTTDDKTQQTAMTLETLRPYHCDLASTYVTDIQGETQYMQGKTPDKVIAKKILLREVSDINSLSDESNNFSLNISIHSLKNLGKNPVLPANRNEQLTLGVQQSQSTTQLHYNFTKDLLQVITQRDLPDKKEKMLAIAGAYGPWLFDNNTKPYLFQAAMGKLYDTIKDSISSIDAVSLYNTIADFTQQILDVFSSSTTSFGVIGEGGEYQSPPLDGNGEEHTLYLRMKASLFSSKFTKERTYTKNKALYDAQNKWEKSTVEYIKILHQSLTEKLDVASKISDDIAVKKGEAERAAIHLIEVAFTHSKQCPENELWRTGTTGGRAFLKELANNTYKAHLVQQILSQKLQEQLTVLKGDTVQNEAKIAKIQTLLRAIDKVEKMQKIPESTMVAILNNTNLKYVPELTTHYVKNIKTDRIHHTDREWNDGMHVIRS